MNWKWFASRLEIMEGKFTIFDRESDNNAWLWAMPGKTSKPTLKIEKLLKRIQGGWNVSISPWENMVISLSQ